MKSGGYIPRRFAYRYISTTIHLSFGDSCILYRATSSVVQLASIWALFVTERSPQHQKLRALVFANSVWVLLRPTELWTLKGCETGPTVYCLYPRRQESPTIGYLETLSVGPAGVFKPTTSRRVARCSTNWAKRSTMQHCYKLSKHQWLPAVLFMTSLAHKISVSVFSVKILILLSSMITSFPEFNSSAVYKQPVTSPRETKDTATQPSAVKTKPATTSGENILVLYSDSLKRTISDGARGIMVLVKSN